MSVRRACSCTTIKSELFDDGGYYDYLRDVGVRVQAVVRLLVRLRSATRRGRRSVDHADGATVDDGVTVRRSLVSGAGEVRGHVVRDGRGGAADEDLLLVGVHTQKKAAARVGSRNGTRHRPLLCTCACRVGKCPRGFFFFFSTVRPDSRVFLGFC